jgi:hypothetical protein
VALATLGTPGCATIVSAARYDVSIVTEPSGADIAVLDSEGTEVFRGRSPVRVPLTTKRGYFTGQDYTVEARLEGFTAQHVPVPRSLDPWYIGNIVFGWGIGFLVVDPLTGAMWKLDKTVRIPLAPREAPLWSATPRPPVAFPSRDIHSHQGGSR